MNRKPIKISRALITKTLDYDQKTGVLTWKSRSDRGSDWNAKCAGKVAGTITPWGYRRVTFDGVKVLAHRIVWFLEKGNWPTGELDHKNGDRLDNRITNLREASQAQNQQNRSAKGRHGMIGASPLPNGRWVARIGVNRRTINLGCHGTQAEAHAAYLRAKRRLHLYQPLPRSIASRTQGGANA